MKKYLSVYALMSIIMVIAAASAFSQEAAPASESAKDPAPVQAAAPAAPQAKEIAIYGEVQAVNLVAKTLSVQYYDYDSDSEKTAEVSLGADAKLENARSISDIKNGDWVDVTYVVSDGKNMAKAVSVEKEEPASEPAAGAAPAAPDMSSDE